MTDYKQIPDYPVRVRASAIVGMSWDGDDDWHLLTLGGHRFYLGDAHTVDALCDKLQSIGDDSHEFIDFDEIDNTAADYRIKARENKQAE